MKDTSHSPALTTPRIAALESATGVESNDAGIAGDRRARSIARVSGPTLPRPESSVSEIIDILHSSGDVMLSECTNTCDSEYARSNPQLIVCGQEGITG